jgi:hypothetical protein
MPLEGQLCVRVNLVKSTGSSVDLILSMSLDTSNALPYLNES